MQHQFWWKAYSAFCLIFTRVWSMNKILVVISVLFDNMNHSFCKPQILIIKFKFQDSNNSLELRHWTLRRSLDFIYNTKMMKRTNSNKTDKWVEMHVCCTCVNVLHWVFNSLFLCLVFFFEYKLNAYIQNDSVFWYFLVFCCFFIRFSWIFNFSFSWKLKTSFFLYCWKPAISYICMKTQSDHNICMCWRIPFHSHTIVFDIHKCICVNAYQTAKIIL